MQNTTREWIHQTIAQLPEEDAEQLKHYLQFLTWKSKTQKPAPKSGAQNPIALRVISAIEKSDEVTMEDAEALLQSIKEGEIPMRFSSPFPPDEQETQ
jgi:primase-polymerase (primpol)-like protein